jgi:hypothetical protein
MGSHEACASADAPVVFQRQCSFAIGAFGHYAADKPLAAAAAGAMIGFPNVVMDDVSP